MPDDTDWNLVVQAQIAIGWIFNSATSVDPNLKASVASYRKKNENCELVNPGLLMSYAYIVFVYPRETAISGIDEANLDFSAFNVSAGDVTIRRIRNAIAHGRFSFSSDAQLTLRDNNRNKTDPFEASISAGDFGNFIQSFAGLAKRTYFDGNQDSANNTMQVDARTSRH